MAAACTDAVVTCWQGAAGGGRRQHQGPPGAPLQGVEQQVVRDRRRAVLPPLHRLGCCLQRLKRVCPGEPWRGSGVQPVVSVLGSMEWALLVLYATPQQHEAQLCNTRTWASRPSVVSWPSTRGSGSGGSPCSPSAGMGTAR